MNRQALIMQLEAARAQLDAALAVLLADEPEAAVPDVTPARPALPALPPMPVQCQHKRRENIGGFGAGGGWQCLDCGATEVKGL